MLLVSGLSLFLIIHVVLTQCCINRAPLY